MSETARLPRSRFPKVEALFRVGEQLWSQREDVRAVHGDIRSWGFWCWMMYAGATEHHELQAAMFPFPEGHLRRRVAGEDLHVFASSGVKDAMRMHRCLSEAGFDFESGGNVLDFGCGCGRLLRVMARFADKVRLHGHDVDGEAIAFCEEAFDFATFGPLPHRPPSSIAEGTFDAIYAYSIFTHLTERDHLAWLGELARIAKPGAPVVLTIGGRHLIDHFLRDDSPMYPPPSMLREALPMLERDGFHFFPFQDRLEFRDEKSQRFFAEWDLADYGMTFILEPYVRQHWLEHFELVDFLPAPDDYQDYVVLRRR